MQKHKLYFLPLLLLLAALTACSKQDDIASGRGTDFESLMGKDLPAWQYVQTKEDFSNVQFFKKIFEQNVSLLSHAVKKEKVPKVMHFIWLGPKPFPRESVENVKSWIAKHPDWTIKFWTDRERPLPHDSMQRVLVKDFNFIKLAECYHKSDNYGEKSDVLRYEILYQEGGVYIDHDVKCLKAFDPFNAAYDFYCGLEMPYKTSLNSSVLPTNNLVASRPYHPILKESIDWLQAHWDQIEKDYPGKDRDSTINRVSHRTFLVMGESFKRVGNREGNRDIAFPAFYFNAPKDELAIMARHLYAGTWFENESQFEKMCRERLMMLSKKTNKILLFVGVMTGLNLFGFFFLFYSFKRRAKT